MWFFSESYKQYIAKVTMFLAAYTMLLETKKWFKFLKILNKSSNLNMEIIQCMPNFLRSYEFDLRMKFLKSRENEIHFFSKIYAYFNYLRISVVGLVFIKQYWSKYERVIDDKIMNLLHCFPKYHLPSNKIYFYTLIVGNLYHAFNVGVNFWLTSF